MVDVVRYVLYSLHGHAYKITVKYSVRHQECWILCTNFLLLLLLYIIIVCVKNYEFEYILFRFSFSNKKDAEAIYWLFSAFKIKVCVLLGYLKFWNIVNGERFAGLNFRVFHGFQEYGKSFSVNIKASL